MLACALNKKERLLWVLLGTWAITGDHCPCVLLLFEACVCMQDPE